MPYPTVLAGQRVTSTMLNAGKMEFVTNSAGSQDNTSTVFINAVDLVFPVEASSRYFVHALICYNAPEPVANGDINFEWTGPSGATMDRNVISPALGMTTNIDTNIQMIRRGIGTDVRSGGTTAPGTATAFTVHEEVCNLVVSTTAGNVQFRFALGAGVGTATLQADSFIYYQRIA